MFSSHQSFHESFLIRFWRHIPHSPWRASIQNVRTGEKRHFAEIEQLWLYLEAELAEASAPQTGQTESGLEDLPELVVRKTA